jgi:6-phosphogluconolactonase
MRWWALAVVAAVLPALAGCDGFFVPENGGGGGGGGGGATGNYVYTSNSSNNTLSGFSISTTGTLTAVPNSPVTLNYSPGPMAITPLNTFLYVAAPGNIQVYAISANGALTATTCATCAALVSVASMDISPDGQWLVGLDTTTQVLDIFQINATSGGLTSVSQTVPYTTTVGVWQPRMVRFSPNAGFIYAALGTAGDVGFTFNTTTGAGVTATYLQVPTTTSDNAVAIDSASANLYIARSGTGPGVAVYNIGAGGSLTQVAGSPFASGLGTFAIQLNTTGAYLYAANRTDGTISGYTIGAGPTLSPLAGSPFSTGSLPTSLGADKTGKYLLSGAFGGAPDLTMYSFSITTPGMLVPATSVATGTPAPTGVIAIALTH